MSGKILKTTALNDMAIANNKQHMYLLNLLQKVGKTKRKITVGLSKSSQKYLEQMVVELKKQMIGQEKSLPNLFSFFNYLQKAVEKKEKKKREKIKNLLISYEEQEFLKLQLNQVIQGIKDERAKLRWYNLIKKALYSSMNVQNEVLLKDISTKIK